MSHLTFVVPVRHPDNSPDWVLQCRFLAATARSIAAQAEPGWRGIVVANEGSELPELPEGFSVEWVTFKPNPAYSISAHGKEVARDAFRLDKGRRVLAGMLAARDSGHFMIVDDDDFVSNTLSGFVKDNPDAPGWYVDTGYGWTEGTDYCVRMQGYSGYCGSSLIVRGDLYNLPDRIEDASEAYIKEWLGGHVRIKHLLRADGHPLAPLPFDGGVYRVGHRNSHSNSGSLWQYFFLNPKYLARPKRLWQNIKGLRKLTPDLEGEFFGAARQGNGAAAKDTPA